MKPVTKLQIHVQIGMIEVEKQCARNSTCVIFEELELWIKYDIPWIGGPMVATKKSCATLAGTSPRLDVQCAKPSGPMVGIRSGNQATRNSDNRSWTVSCSTT